MLARTRLSAIAGKHPCVLAKGTPLRSGMLADWLAGLFGLRACFFACALVLHVPVLLSSGLGC